MVTRFKRWRYSKMFGVIKLTKNVDPNKYSYFGYGIGFDSRSLFSYADFDWVENIVCQFFFLFFFFFLFNDFWY